MPGAEPPGISAHFLSDSLPHRDSWESRKSQNSDFPPFYLAVVFCVSEKRGEKTENKNTNFAGAVSEPP